MRALELQRLEGPDGFVLAERAEPEGGDEVIVEVHSAGVAFPDLLIGKGAYQESPQLPYVAGQEVGGVVRSAPPGSGFAAGDRVWALPGSGGFAEVCAVPAACVFPLVDELDFADGAALGANFATAIFALGRRGRLAAGESVLVLGAGGGLGTATVAVAKALGARVLGVASTAEKAEVARAAGAEEVIVGADWNKAVLELTGGRGVDLVADIVGGEETLQAIRSTAAEGRVLILGFAGGAIPEIKANRLLLRNIAVVGAGLGAFSTVEPDIIATSGTALNRLVDAGLRPLIGAHFPFEQGAEALRELDRRAAKGKIVLDVVAG